MPDITTSIENKIFRALVLILHNKKPPISPPATAGTVNGKKPSKLSSPVVAYMTNDTIEIGNIMQSAFAKISRPSHRPLISFDNTKTMIIPPPAPSSPFIKPLKIPPRSNARFEGVKKLIFLFINIKNSLKNMGTYDIIYKVLIFILLPRINNKFKHRAFNALVEV